MQYLVAFCNRLEGASDIISGDFVRQIFLDKVVKLGDPCLNRSREIPPRTVPGGIFDSCFHHNFRPEVDNDIIFAMAVDHVGMDVRVTFGDSR